MLNIDGVCLRFGGITAVDDVSFTVDRKEIVSLIGPNGSGKTSVLNIISGFYKSQKGRVIFEGTDITNLSPHKRAALGISRTFQNLALYFRENVLENIMAGAVVKSKANLVDCMLYSKRARGENLHSRALAEEVIEFLGLDEYRYLPAGTLSMGWAKRVELGRALMLNPKLLLLDEVMAGLTMGDKEDIVRRIKQLRDEKDITTLLVEHDVKMVMRVSDRVIVMNEGRIISEGPPEKVAKDPLVIKAYFGG